MIDPGKYGVTFSIKQIRSFQLDQGKTLGFLLNNLGFRRFRLMSYWNEHEKKPGAYDFSKLDQQIDIIEKAGGVITLCLGARQPRWPESHWPKWSLELPRQDRYQKLYQYIEIVVKRYHGRGCIISYQLENEALNRSFGRNGDFDRQRLRREYRLVKKIDPHRPIIMSTSNTWGLPIRRPRPDLFGFTLYTVQYEKGQYSRVKLPIWWWPLRAKIIRILTFRKSFIHELQAEPWGPKAIWEMTQEEQDKSMSREQLIKNINLARKTKLYPIDLWGGEWWYWRHQQGDDQLANIVRENLTSNV